MEQNHGMAEEGSPKKIAPPAPAHLAGRHVPAQKIGFERDGGDYGYHKGRRKVKG
jgi:hypothetical protein